jgi:methylmalonyl-CoA/ethylmalonyl-CoA epimerase
MTFQEPQSRPAGPLPGIGQIAITVKDLPRAVAFYRDVLGMPFLFQAPPGLAFFDCGGVRLMLTSPEPGPNPSGTSIIYYKVSDIAAVHDLLTGRGVVFEEKPRFLVRMPDHDLWMGAFRDSEGNAVGVMSEVRR